MLCFCKVLLDHQIKVAREVENVIKKFTDLIFHRFRLICQLNTTLCLLQNLSGFKIKLDCIF